jgi:hypothetical protein
MPLQKSRVNLARTTPSLILMIGTVVVATALVSTAQSPPLERTPPATPGISADAEISIHDALDTSRAAYLMALGAEEAHQITEVSELETGGDRFLATRLREPAIRLSVEEAQWQYVLPYRFGVVTPGGSGRLNLRAVAVVEQGGLRVDPDTVSYRGSVRVGIENQDDPAAPPVELKNAVLFMLNFSGGSVQPRDLEITHTNLPFESVALSALQAPEQPVLNFRASFDPPEGTDVEIPVVPIDVLSAPEAIPGLGFGYGEVNIQLPDFLVGRIMEVTLTTSRGYLKPNHVKLSESGHGRSVLRSAYKGAGEAHVTIERDDLVFTPVTVRFFWPWTLFIAVAAGALVSGAIFAFNETKGGLWLGFFVGLVTGVAICGGINLTGRELPNFATVVVAFVAAALPGFLIVAKKIFGSK